MPRAISVADRLPHLRYMEHGVVEYECEQGDVLIVIMNLMVHCGWTVWVDWSIIGLLHSNQSLFHKKESKNQHSSVLCPPRIGSVLGPLDFLVKWPRCSTAVTVRD